MNIRKYLHEITESEIDITPMLDIVFIMLIFFIVTSSFVKEEGILVNKSKANNIPKHNNPMILVKINETGLASLNNKLVNIERLPSQIKTFLAEN